MSSLPSLVLLLIFVASAAVIWGAGIRLSSYTDVLAERLHLGSALGGVGNLLGGIAIPTVVLVALDAFGVVGLVALP
ncbi:hypothetical protein [Modestobacter excelsi]|uniref:hypothetical protein n=1 Tax=Modestobacter excelsi TaxID=2213161 RepID=UPI001C20E912|nr:hypothetical protein [Modestobacter excelsi]